MNPYLQSLNPYPFQKLALLKNGVTGNTRYTPIDLSIGEPKMASPQFVIEAMRGQLADLNRYAPTQGSPPLRQAICDWLVERYGINPMLLDAERHVLPVNGTREALFAVAQALVDPQRSPRVLMPNPFYQVYEGAALLAGAQAYYVNADSQPPYQIDLQSIPISVWRQCQLFYLCNPYNPTGAVMDMTQMTWLMDMAQRYDFVIASDECYSEIYCDEPPPGLLQAAVTCGNDRFEKCMVFHSLSKRSNLPGLRSGFVAGDPELMEKFLLYRTYHGCAMPLPVQAASIAAWSDETHVEDNRQVYRNNFQAVLTILFPALPLSLPQAGFYLWPKVPADDCQFAKNFYQAYNVTVLPGSYLSRESAGTNPGTSHLRIALVAELETCKDMAQRLKSFLEQ